MEKIFFFSLLLALAYCSSVYAQTDDAVVAKAGSKIITKGEFTERYEMTPQFRKDLHQIAPAAKLEFIYTLLAEKLWALEAAEKGLDTTEIMKFVSSAFEKMFIRDALYRKEIKEKAVVDDKELIRGYVKSKTKLKVKFIFSTEEKEISNLYDLLKEGVPFDTILAAGPEVNEQKEPIEVSYGQMQDQIEDSLYRLKVGQYTAPMFTPDGWYIFKLVNKIESVFETQQDKDNAQRTVEKTIKARKEAELYAEFYKNFFKDKKVDMNGVMFGSLSEKISDLFTKKRAEYKTKQDEPVYFETGDVLKIERELGEDSLKINFLQFEKNPVTTKVFIRQLVFDGFSSKDTDIKSIKLALGKRIRKMIEQELLAREAYSQGYQNLPEVKNEVAMWKDNYLFQLNQNQIYDSADVTDKEVLAYYKTLNKETTPPQLVNIAEVLTDSLEVVEQVLNELKNGGDIKELAAKYSKREWTKKKNGEFGFFPVTAYGEIGRIAGTMKVGDIYGPLKVKEGYSVFKLIDKKDQPKEARQPFEQIKEKLKEELAQQKTSRNAINHTVDMAFKYGIDIDPKIFNSIETTDVNAFTLRYMGFGGRITAAPLIAPNVEWVDLYFKRKNMLP